MQHRTFRPQARLRALFMASGLASLAFGFAALAAAQTPPSKPSPAINTPAAKNTFPATNEDWLTQAGKLYYSSTAAGLKGFDCDVKPDWQTAISQAKSVQLSAADQAQAIALLNAVKIALHARMDGGAILDWNPPAQSLDAKQIKMLDAEHSAFNQMLVQGFMQFWTPFIEGQMIPDSSTGLEVAVTDDGGRKIRIKQPQLEMSETFDSGHILRQVSVTLTGMRVEMAPTYSPSDHGLVVTHLHFFIRPATDAQSTMEMNVEITYQWLEGFPIPAHIDMNVEKVVDVNVAFENCTVQH